MRKILIAIMILVLLVPAMVGARSFFELGLGFSGIYDATGSDSLERFLEGMVEGDRWTIGIGLNSRISIIDFSLLAVPTACENQDNSLLLFSSVSLSIPLITNVVYVGFGAGLTTDFLFPSEGESKILSKAVSEISFSEVITDSPLHLRFSLDVLFGPAKFGVFYMRKTQATVGTLEGNGGWARLFQMGGDDRVGLALNLALF